MRVALPHFGQSVLLDVSITFLRSAVFAIFMLYLLAKLFHGAIRPARKKTTLNKNSGALSRTGTRRYRFYMNQAATVLAGLHAYQDPVFSVASDFGQPVGVTSTPR